MKTVIEMARDQGLPETEVVGVFIVNQDDLGRFAELVRADEREACANAMARIVMTPTLTHGALVKLSDVVNAIRARSNT